MSSGSQEAEFVGACGIKIKLNSPSNVASLKRMHRKICIKCKNASEGITDVTNDSFRNNTNTNKIFDAHSKKFNTFIENF